MSTTPVSASTTRYPGGCLQPVLLRGSVDHIDGATGELLHRYTTVHERGGVLPIAGKTRRASQCPPCAEVYRADTYQLIRAGLSGGKGIPDTVATHPCVFTTVTAPSFGPVHVHREKDGRVLRCCPRRHGRTCPHGRRMSCATRHSRDDILLGEPLCPDCYDYTGAVPVQRLRPRTVAPFRHHASPRSGPPGRAHQQGTRRPGPGLLRQGRRIPAARRRPLPGHHPPRWPRRADDGPARLGDPCPARRRQRPGRPHRPPGYPGRPGLPARTLAWERELDTRPIATTGEPTGSRVAAYVAKYATKAAACTGTLDRRVTPADQLADLPIRDHARRLIAECLRLSTLPGLERPRLAAWAHMLGFRGHFSTKSRTYSITLGALRADRAAYQREQARAAGYMPDLAPDSTLVLTRWHFARRGHPLIDPPGPLDPPPADQCDGSHREGVDDVA